MIRKPQLLAMATAAFFMSSCMGTDSDPTSSNDDGSIHATLHGQVSIALTASPNSVFSEIADSAAVIISAEDMDSIVQELSVASGTLSGTINGIPVGADRNFSVLVFDAKKVLQYQGSTKAEIIADSTVPITITIRRIGGDASINGVIIDDSLLIIQPSPDESMDAEINFGSPGNNYWTTYNFGALNYMSTGVYDYQTWMRGLIKFGLPDLDPTKVVSATLEMTPVKWTKKTANIPFPVELHTILKSWKEGSGSPIVDNWQQNSATIDGVTAQDRYYDGSATTADWNEYGLGLDDDDASSLAISTVVVPYESYESVQWSITTTVKKWLENPSTNNGLLVKWADEETSTTYTSFPSFGTGEQTDATKRPRLILTIRQ